MNIIKKIKNWFDRLLTINYDMTDIAYDDDGYRIIIGIRPIKCYEGSNITKDYLVIHVIKCDSEGNETDFQAYTAVDKDLSLLPLVDLFKHVNPFIEKCKDKINSELNKDNLKDS